MPDVTAAREPARFEYRVWSDALDDAGARLRAMSQSAELLSGHETYLLSRATAAVNPKVREGLLDVKVLVEEVDGFQRWDVDSKLEFPIEAPAVANLIDLLAGDPRQLTRTAYSLENLIGEVFDPQPDLVAVEVLKERELHSVAGCRAEITIATIEGKRHRTIAIESADMQRLGELRASLGLASHPNISYPRAVLAVVEDRIGGDGN